MLPWPFTIFVAVCLLAFAIPVLSFAISIWALLAAKLLTNIWQRAWGSLIGTLLTIAVMAPFSWMFGSGAYRLGSSVIDGLIGRFL